MEFDEESETEFEQVDTGGKEGLAVGLVLGRKGLGGKGLEVGLGGGGGLALGLEFCLK